MLREYLGVLDDVIFRYRPKPYGSEGFIKAVLAEGLLYGAPGLLNDGYLVQHPVLRDLLLRRDAGFLDLLQRDQVLVSSAIRPPSASIERRASVGVASHRTIVTSADWATLATAIDDLPNASGTSWPSRNLTDGFVALAQLLRDLVLDGGLPASIALPLGATILEFLDAFFVALERHHDAPRTQWEALASNTWQGDGPEFLAMMDLANLLYHLNITMLLGADDETARTVVTRDHPILAPLLGVGRVDEVLLLPETEFTAVPDLNPDGIASLLEDPTLKKIRGEVGARYDAATLSEYLGAIGRTKLTRDLRVPPISNATIVDRGGTSRLQVTHVHASRALEHIRLIIPTELCTRHAANAWRFEVS
jgi:hypothetical protein